MDGLTLRYIYAVIQVIGVVILIGELIYVSFQKPSTLQRTLLVILFTILISHVGYFIELIADDITTAYIGCCLGYLGKPFALMASLLLLLEYANIKIKKGYILGVTLFFLFLTCMVVTNKYHNLYYTDIAFDTQKSGSPLVIVGHGIFWYVYMISSFSIFFAFSFIAFYEFKNSKTSQARQMAIILFFVIFFAFLGLFLYIFKLTFNYDSTLLGIMIGTILLLILFTKYRMFGSITEAQHKALNESKNGIIVVDARMSISYFNATAKSIVPELKINMGRKVEGKIIDDVENLKEGEIIHVNDKVYSLSFDNEVVGNKRFVGKTYTFKEITEHYNYQETLNNEIKRVTKKLQGIQRNALISFADIVEARDGNTGEHVKSVSKTANLIATALRKNRKYAFSLTSDFISTITECAPLHDIGKISVPDHILTKPGKLTPEEFEIMKTHTLRGYQIIQDSIKELEEPNYVRISSEIALSHHERWDGTGYPNKLKGDDIPLSARIIAVADVYDALRMKRSYKDSYSKEKSIEIITEESGTHLDPEIVEAFLSIKDKLK